MDFADGFANSLGAITDFRDRQRQRNLQERRVDLAETEAQRRQGQRVAQNRRAVAQDQRAEQQLESTLETQEAQREKFRIQSDKASEELALLRDTLDAQKKQIRSESDRASSLAEIARLKAQKLDAETQGERASVVLDFFSDLSVDTAANDPGRFAQGVGEFANVAGLGDTVPTMLPLGNDRFASVEKNDAGEFVKETDEDGNPIIFSREEAQSMLQRLRREAESVSLSAPDGGAAVTRSLETLSGLGRGSGASQGQVEQVRGQIDQGLEQTGTVQENQRRIGELNSEIRTLDSIGRDLIGGVQPNNQSGSRSPTSNGLPATGRSAAVAPEGEPDRPIVDFFTPDPDLQTGAGRSAVVNRERDGESEADLNNLSEDEVDARIQSLDGGREVFAREVINRGSEAVAERDTLSGRTLPKAKRLERKRAQLREIERASPERLQQTQEIMRAANTLARGNGKNLTLEQAFNIMNTGSPDVSIADASEDEVDQHEEFQSRAEEVWDGVDRTNIEDDGRNDAAQKKNFSSRGFSQTMALAAQQPEVARALKDTGQLRQLAADATEIADERGSNTPNVFLAAQTFDSNVDTKRAASVFDKVVSLQTVGSEEIGKPEQSRIMRQIVQALESNQGKTDEQVAGEVFSQMQRDNQLNQPGSSNTIF